MNKRLLDDCPPILKDFLFYMETIKGRSTRTVEAYYIDLRMFLRYLKTLKTNQDFTMDFEAIKIGDVTTEMICSTTLSDVYEFLNFTLGERSNNAKTRSRKVSSIRSFFKYLNTKTPYLPQNPVKDLEVPSLKRTMPKYLTLEESLELLIHIDSNFYERDFCIITLFLNCGMRVSELVQINLEDIREDTLKLLGKGNKERIIYLNQACLDAIDKYLSIRQSVNHGIIKDKHALFLSTRGTRLTARRVEQIVEDCLKAANLDGKGYSPHKLRHTAATLMYQHSGVDIRVLKEILGHANLGTTEIYTHVSNQQLEKAASLSPLAKVKSRK